MGTGVTPLLKPPGHHRQTFIFVYNRSNDLDALSLLKIISQMSNIKFPMSNQIQMLKYQNLTLI